MSFDLPNLPFGWDFLPLESCARPMSVNLRGLRSEGWFSSLEIGAMPSPALHKERKRAGSAQTKLPQSRGCQRFGRRRLPNRVRQPPLASQIEAFSRRATVKTGVDEGRQQ